MSEVGDKLKDAAGAVGLARRDDGETSTTKGLSSKELLDAQRAQMNAQDETLEKLIPLTEKLNDTAGMICDEVNLQSRMVEDLGRDFRHTQERQKKLRKQGFKLSGQKNEEEKERAEREEAMEELRKQVTLQQVQNSYEQEEEEERTCALTRRRREDFLRVGQSMCLRAVFGDFTRRRAPRSHTAKGSKNLPPRGFPGDSSA